MKNIRCTVNLFLSINLENKYILFYFKIQLQYSLVLVFHIWILKKNGDDNGNLIN